MDKTKYWLRESKKKPKSSFQKYKERVKELTEQIKHMIPGIEDRGYYKYHIDHKISVRWGFENNIPEEHISDISNLRMLWWKDNLNKNIICDVDEKNSWIVQGKEVFTKRGITLRDEGSPIGDP